MSKQGRWATVEKPDAASGNNDIFLLDLDRPGVATRFTSDPGSDTRAVFLYDDSTVVWGSNRNGHYDLYAKPASGGDERALLESADSKIPTGGSVDGRFLFYESVEGAASKTRLRALRLDGSRTSFPLLNSAFNEAQARMSPDGRWIAYTTDRDGANEVYVIPAAAVLPARGQMLPSPSSSAASQRVSTNGGAQPMWRDDRTRLELYYMAADRRLMAVTVTGDTPSLPTALFETRVLDGTRAYQRFAPSPDGSRFLVLSRTEESPAATIVSNWLALLAAK